MYGVKVTYTIDNLKIKNKELQVDREFDGGKLLAHKAFWNYPLTRVNVSKPMINLFFIENEINLLIICMYIIYDTSMRLRNDRKAKK